MISSDYLRLCQEAQNKKIKIAREQEKQIRSLYEDIYKDLSDRLKKATPGSLTERWIIEYQRSLKKEIQQLNNKIYGVIEKNMKYASNIAVGPDFSFFMILDNKYKLDMESTFTSMFSNIPKDALNEILFGEVYKDRKGLSERIWQDTKKIDKDIDYIIAKGIAEQKSSFEIAKDLEKYVNPKAKKDWNWSKVYPKSNKKVDYNAQRLARTSVSHAFQQAQKRSCQRNPFVSGIKWLTSNSHRTCELCSSRNGVIYSVSDLPLDHPNGMCTTVPVLEKELEQIGEELRSWIDGESNTKLDKWFKEYGKDFL
ncbi:MAG: hypothetical protein KIB53_02050 [Paraclostridium bifermentans]|uniref:hypothetical protein n=1 Tax=Paraclostridium bifermentans TaxID=1490 RepID=UPI00241D9399|nr:hypothetical protein [Paraclostridium bifermentans]MBS5952572.1 hypothetical protein [Paraclostridium bifermentans]